MKQPLRFFIPVAIFTLACIFSSCTREYTCQCTITYSGYPGLPEPVVKEYSITDTKKDAESKCQDNSDSSVTNGIKTVEDCKLW